MPIALISALSSFIAFILHRVIRYRRATSLTNLARCFPEKSERELLRLLPLVYLNITDVLFETIKAFSTPPKELLRYITPPSEDELRTYREHYRGAIIATAHLTNWEWCGFTLAEILKDEGIAVYRPIKNPKVDKVMLNHRQRSGMKIIPMRQIVKHIASGEADGQFVLLIADQSPDPDTAYWGPFFGIKTPFFRGAGVIACKYDLPVFFVRLVRIARHRYQMRLEPLCTNPTGTTPDGILQEYITALEAHIREQPPYWLWTHRRWKHSPPVDDQIS